MSSVSSRVGHIVDCHTHLGEASTIDHLVAIQHHVGIERTNIVSIQDPRRGWGNPQGFVAKARYPGRFYLFGGLDHAAFLSGGQVTTPSLAQQVDLLVAAGCDGIKMIEGKPTSRPDLPMPLDDAYYADFFAHAQDIGLPLLWHVGDPEEFWDPDKTPAWAKDSGWGYGPDDVPKEALYAEVDRVLQRYPRLKVVFAHLYFLSADLPRAARFLDAHPGVGMDLAPGVEMIYNTSSDPDATREFFVRYRQRIYFGTDISSRLTLAQAEARAGITVRWLETDDSYTVPPEVDVLLGSAEDGVMRGMDLPDEALECILGGNFARLAGERPRPVETAAVIEECRRMAANAAGWTGEPADATQAAIAARELAATPA